MPDIGQSDKRKWYTVGAICKEPYLPSLLAILYRTVVPRLPVSYQDPLVLYSTSHHDGY